MAARIGAVVSGFFGVLSIFIGQGGLWIGILSAVGAIGKGKKEADDASAIYAECAASFR